ncbi:MAG TPA: hypothetical protein PKW95_06155 [bacterium]|nr:hypothetical protein [bacterium]
MVVQPGNNNRHRKNSRNRHTNADTRRPTGKRGPRTHGRGGQNREQRETREAETKYIPPKGNGTVDPFELFCALHLGITHDDRYRPQNMHDIARRFGVNISELNNKIAELGMDMDTIRRSEFDLSMAQYDIKVAPEGISRRELARDWYEEFQRAVNIELPAVAATEGEELSVEPEMPCPLFDDEI